ncbi:MAG: hypothetical protein KME16_27155 [Scytolyngbya sp. HA4215-MV1]|nr:hypothetical protein [Scytolyngbya sp. HA4215-MV1]
MPALNDELLSEISVGNCVVGLGSFGAVSVPCVVSEGYGSPAFAIAM